MKSTTTYLHFNGNCRTAMAFYRECFSGELEVMADPDASGTPNTDPKAPVQHSMIAHGGQSLLMADGPSPSRRLGEAVARRTHVLGRAAHVRELCERREPPRGGAARGLVQGRARHPRPARPARPASLFRACLCGSKWLDWCVSRRTHRLALGGRPAGTCACPGGEAPTVTAVRA
jgi:PhnB protein